MSDHTTFNIAAGTKTIITIVLICFLSFNRRRHCRRNLSKNLFDFVLSFAHFFEKSTLFFKKNKNFFKIFSGRKKKALASLCGLSNF